MTKILLLSYVKKMTSTKGPNKWIRALTGVSFVLLAFVTVFVSFTYFTTSFRSDKQKDRVQRVSVSCSYNQSALRQMENRLQDTGLPPEERAVLKGIFWCVTFIDSDEHFHSIFTDYVTMLYELTLNTDSSYVRGIAFKLAQDAFKRATDRLVAIFPYSASGKWDFISIIPLLYIFDADISPYRLFYHNSLPSSDAHPSRKTFYEAALSLDYDNLTDYLVDYSFLNFAHHLVPREEFRLPPDQFPEYRGLSELIPFIHGPNSERFSEQNYYVTHLVYARSHYGSRAGYKGSFEKEILAYLERNYPNVRSGNIDLDLLAEFAHCLKIYGQDDSPLVANAIEYLLRKQKRDGSWGTRKDKAGDPYDAFHPTWTAVVAIQYSSFAVKTP